MENNTATMSYVEIKIPAILQKGLEKIYNGIYLTHKEKMDFPIEHFYASLLNCGLNDAINHSVMETQQEIKNNGQN